MTDNKALILRQPDDWHVHLRDGEALADTVAATARQFARAIVMPNLKPPVTTAALGRSYRDRITAAIPPGTDFTPLMTLYLTDHQDPAELDPTVFTAAKLYPAHATTNSAAGVTAIAHIRPMLDTLQRLDLPLLVHGEVTDHDVDIFDREAVFIERTLKQLVNDYPALRIVFEHITTRDAVAFVEACGPNVAATITPHHLALNRNAMFDGGIRPHAYCLPVAKREVHRQALLAAATSGSPKFFLGTDSAPHEVSTKESACGCAGIYNAPVALESYAASFEAMGALDRLEGFASEHGPRFYRLPLNEGRVRLDRTAFTVPDRQTVGQGKVVPFMANEVLNWSFSGPIPPQN
ncbi:dihydroorotase [Polymorphobacter sp.]|uniref:dihydroorotase n=1 Tax=Polymorphobacter sp. TaxID=1909290 RepID=UPI003F6FBB60